MRTGRWTRWSAPAVAAVAIAAVSVAPSAFATSDHPQLPTKTASQLIAAVEQSNVQTFSGKVRTVANLGLPQLPDQLTGTGSAVTALLTGTNSLRVWVDGPARQRVALLRNLSETDVIHNGSDLWTYASSDNTVTHRRLASSDGTTRRGPAESPATGAAGQLTPQAQADEALKAINPSTAVRVDRTARVAGRAAYQLILTPRTSATLVRSVRIAIDAATSVPLRVQVYAAGFSAPVWQTGFTAISFATPSSRVFDFAPPRGARLSNSRPGSRPRTMTGPDGSPRPGLAPRSPGAAPTSPNGQPMPGRWSAAPTAIGEGWATILELPAGTLDATANAPMAPDGTTPSSAGILNRVTTPVPQGRLLTTRLVSVLITPDGRVFVGAVPAAAVESAASSSGS